LGDSRVGWRQGLMVTVPPQTCAINPCSQFSLKVVTSAIHHVERVYFMP